MMENSKSPEAKCSTVVVCLLFIIIGQGVLLRDVFAAGLTAWPPAVKLELVFCAVMAAAMVWCWTHPRGRTSNLGCAAAFGFFGLYAVFNIVFYDTFVQLFLAGIENGAESWGKAMVALKLVLAIMAVVAGIPAATAPTGREYAEKLKEAAYRQQAQWAKGSAAGAKKDLDSAMEKLRETLTPEEMDALLAQLRSEQAPPKDGESVTEQWRGWGGGI